MAAYAAAIAVGVTLHELGSDRSYALYKDMSGFILAIPAAWLVFCFQRRIGYLTQVRGLWTTLIAAVQEAIQYTHAVEPPDQKEWGRVLATLSRAIDETRGVFMNVGEDHRQIGLFPFEPIKRVHGIISTLGFGDRFTSGRTKRARELVLEEWKALRRPFLIEFDRAIPEMPHVHGGDIPTMLEETT